MQPAVDPGTIGLGGHSGTVAQRKGRSLRVVDRPDYFVKLDLAAADLQQILTVWLWHRQCDATRRQQLDPLHTESKRVHRELRVVTVLGDQLRSVGVRTGTAGHRVSLALQVSDEPVSGETGNEPVAIGDELGANLVAGGPSYGQAARRFT